MCVKRANEMGGVKVEGVMRPVKFVSLTDDGGSTLETTLPNMIDPSHADYLPGVDCIFGRNNGQNFSKCFPKASFQMFVPFCAISCRRP